MRRFMLAALLLSLLAMPLGLTGAAAAPHEEHALNLILDMKEKSVASETILTGETFGYKNSAWMRLGLQVDHRMRAEAINGEMAGQVAMARGMANAQAPLPEPTFNAVNLETGETISLPYGVPVVPLNASLTLAPKSTSDPNTGALGARAPRLVAG